MRNDLCVYCWGTGEDYFFSDCANCLGTGREGHVTPDFRPKRDPKKLAEEVMEKAFGVKP